MSWQRNLFYGRARSNSGMVSDGYGQQLTQLKGGNIQLKAMYITENIHYGRQEGEKHLASTCKRVLRGQKNTTFFTGMMISMN